MANLTIKPQAGTGNKLIIQDQAGNARVTTSDAGIDIPAVTGNFAAAGNVTSTGNLTVSGDFVPATPLSHRNMIINGAMNVAQRATTSSSNRNSGYQCVDRFRCQETNLGNIAIVQSQYAMSSAELNTTGQSKAFKMDVNTAESAIGASEKWSIDYRFEGQDLQHLQYGTANAQSVTLSFWAKSNVAGVYGISMLQTDGAKRIGSTYTLASNVWKKVSITFIGNTADLIVNDNTQGLEITWGLLVGGNFTGGTNTSWGATADNKYFNGHTAVWGTSTSDDFYITGVQLEVGSSATPFEHRSYGDELFRCQRYYEKGAATSNEPIRMWPINTDNNGGYRRTNIWLANTMRTIPNPITATIVAAGSTSSGIQFANRRTFVPYSNQSAASGEGQVNAWTAEAEL